MKLKDPTGLLPWLAYLAGYLWRWRPKKKKPKEPKPLISSMIGGPPVATSEFSHAAAWEAVSTRLQEQAMGYEGLTGTGNHMAWLTRQQGSLGLYPQSNPASNKQLGIHGISMEDLERGTGKGEEE